MAKKSNKKNKYDFLIFGAGGMQGRIVIKDLLEKGYKIFVSDFYQQHIDTLQEKFPNLDYELADLRNIKEAVTLIKKVKPYLVVNCAEADWNLNVYKACLRNKVHVIDLCSDIPMTKDQLAMDSDFRKQKLIAITGCGSTPGINNVMLDYAVGLLDSVHTVEAGFAWNSNIKEFVVPFSIPSIVEEFTVPATMMKNGKWIKKIPYDTIKGKRYQEVGRNKIFLVRHPEPYTFYLYYKDKGLKNIKFYGGFPTHSFSTINSFIKLGLASKEKFKINGSEIIPLEVLTEILREAEVPEDYREKEVLWVEAIGKKDNKIKKIYMECIVDTLPGWEDAGCNIDTGIPASIIAQMVIKGKIKAWGSFAPEAVVPKEDFFKALKEKDMDIYMNGKIIN
ncbi:MAG: saccharopine dehydrogenase NADP-binding domain-containing protein [Candidatus Staskawiczbacteria bacterium]|nr:saccharopine dehydrogenase NADP-binding domain-containing protein [Candidatus Staskawiczbacteria bacterium]